jgi:hypothetical protein
MIGVSSVPLPRNWGGIPRISAVSMRSSVRAGTDEYGLILVAERGNWFVSGHTSALATGRRRLILQRPQIMSAALHIPPLAFTSMHHQRAGARLPFNVGSVEVSKRRALDQSTRLHRIAQIFPGPANHARRLLYFYSSGRTTSRSGSLPRRSPSPSIASSLESRNSRPELPSSCMGRSRGAPDSRPRFATPNDKLPTVVKSQNAARFMELWDNFVGSHQNLQGDLSFDSLHLNGGDTRCGPRCCGRPSTRYFPPVSSDSLASIPNAVERNGPRFPRSGQRSHIWRNHDGHLWAEERAYPGDDFVRSERVSFNFGPVADTGEHQDGVEARFDPGDDVGVHTVTDHGGVL